MHPTLIFLEMFAGAYAFAVWCELIPCRWLRIASPRAFISVISTLRYDDETWTMGVIFLGGSTYHYFDVPAETWDGIKAAPSQGIYLNEEVKGRFTYAKV
jgi:hypothetical protein